MADKRFTKQNIDKLIYDPTDSGLKKFILNYILAPGLDFFPIYCTFLWTDLYLIFKFDYSLFLLILVPLLLCSLIPIYIVFIKYYLIKVNKYKINLPSLANKINKEQSVSSSGTNIPNFFSFAFLSDIHIGKEYYGTNIIRLKKIIKKINELNLEMVIIDGDFIGYKIEREMLLELKDIKAKYKIAVYGNHDCDYLGEERLEKEPEELLRIIKRTGFKILNNDGELIKIGNQEIYFGGIPDLYTRRFDVAKAFASAPKDVPKILLSHNPDIIDFIEDSDNIDLILSGHNHSGMIFLKPFGALLPMPTKYKWLTKGIFKIGKRTKLFLTQGIGYSTTRTRLGTESEIAIIELQ